MGSTKLGGPQTTLGWPGRPHPVGGGWQRPDPGTPGRGLSAPQQARQGWGWYRGTAEGVQAARGTGERRFGAYPPDTGGGLEMGKRWEPIILALCLGSFSLFDLRVVVVVVVVSG